jgi:hypothetical protein
MTEDDNMPTQHDKAHHDTRYIFSSIA